MLFLDGKIQVEGNSDKKWMESITAERRENPFVGTPLIVPRFHVQEGWTAQSLASLFEDSAQVRHI